MKYTKAVMLIDEEGDVLIERTEELTGDMVKGVIAELTEGITNEQIIQGMETIPMPHFAQPEETTGRKCGQCGKRGHSRRTCGDAAKGPQDDGTAMTVQQFATAKKRREEDVPSADVADELGVELREVNMAFGAGSYKGYLRDRARD